MSNAVDPRAVMRADNAFGIPACFYWTVDDVVNWVESIGYAKYKENFRTHAINGRKLLTVDSCFLPKMGITNFGDILDLKKQLEHMMSHRVPECYPLPRSKLPRLYQCHMTMPPSLTLSSYPSRTEALLQSARCYPWDYFIYD